MGRAISAALTATRRRPCGIPRRRLSKIAEELLIEIDKDTVGFRPNYDNSLKEPVVLPARFPQLLVNGTSGIAVGMSCSFPPHNIGEVIDGLAALIDNSDH